MVWDPLSLILPSAAMPDLGAGEIAARRDSDPSASAGASIEAIARRKMVLGGQDPCMREVLPFAEPTAGGFSLPVSMRMAYASRMRQRNARVMGRCGWLCQSHY
jgi:hypothetical protein